MLDSCGVMGDRCGLSDSYQHDHPSHELRDHHATTCKVKVVAHAG